MIWNMPNIPNLEDIEVGIEFHKIKLSDLYGTNVCYVHWRERSNVYSWCEGNMINIEYQGSIYHYDIWLIKDEKHMLWFKLRWL
jgi:hypothetical protein